MSWEIKDEWIDLAAATHTVVFHNRDVMVSKDGKQVPIEHHLVNYFNLPACPTCGNPQATEHVDFEKLKAETHEKLHAHHKHVHGYREKHPQVRIGSGPKK